MVPVVKVCIYCQEKKPESAFNRERVRLEAFGLFQDNLVLDWRLQGLQRLLQQGHRTEVRSRLGGGLLPVHDRDEVHRGLQVAGEEEYDACRGSRRRQRRGYLTASQDGGPDLGFDFAPCFGFSLTEDGPKTWFSREALPTSRRSRSRA
jgi:hypothetical protein